MSVMVWHVVSAHAWFPRATVSAVHVGGVTYIMYLLHVLCNVATVRNELNAKDSHCKAEKTPKKKGTREPRKELKKGKCS